MNWRITALIAALYGLLAVVLAALGAHLLPMNEPGAAKLWATALQIHMFHAAALLAVAALAASLRSAFISWSGVLMAIGVLMFSGSLYMRAAGHEFLPGPVTPLGGLVIMLGWAMLFMTVAIDKSDREAQRNEPPAL